MSLPSLPRAGFAENKMDEKSKNNEEQQIE